MKLYFVFDPPPRTYMAYDGIKLTAVKPGMSLIQKVSSVLGTEMKIAS